MGEGVSVLAAAGSVEGAPVKGEGAVVGKGSGAAVAAGWAAVGAA